MLSLTKSYITYYCVKIKATNRLTLFCSIYRSSAGATIYNDSGFGASRRVYIQAIRFLHLTIYDDANIIYFHRTYTLLIDNSHISDSI